MFCVNCGSKLDTNGIKFCPYCGNKIPHELNENLDVYQNEEVNVQPVSNMAANPLLETFKKQIVKKRITEPLREVEWTDEKAYKENVYQLLCTHLQSSSQYGENLFIKGQNRIDEDLFYSFRNYYEVQDPIMLFKYGSSSNSIEGFVLDYHEIVYCVARNEGRIALSQIENVVYAKRILAPVMFFRLKGGEISDDIYLTGIRKVEDFVIRFRNFIFQLNNIGVEKEGISLRPEESVSDTNIAQKNMKSDMDQALEHICFKNRFRSDCCEIGNPISLRSNRMAQAMEYFDIPLNINTYLIYDSTTSGKTCKEGFALCTDGFHYRYEKQTGLIPWEYFASVKIKKFISCINVDGMMFATAFETKKILDILWKVQNYLNELLA